MAIVGLKERRIARLMVQETQRLERIGVRAALGVAMRVQGQVLRAFRAGRDPVQALKAVFERALPLLTDAMLNSHLTGVLRVKRNTPIQFQTTQFRETTRFLKKRLELTSVQLAELEVTYQAEALRVLNSVSATAERALEKTVTQIHLEGLHVRAGVRELEKTFVKIGIVPRNSFTLETIFRTQTQMATSAGQWNRDQDPVIQEVLWGYKYVTVGDARVRDSHAELEGVTLPKDDPRWDQIFPPNGFNCRCQAIPIFDEREQVDPPDGSVGPDKGFQFNPGKVFEPAPGIGV